ncbi:hypothetical protein BC943DRAFT_326396 [Umbelopsis sp. AD052]|nr:hypothetical protein BC943DRAFT_326396 [Umbelopsis sp. AD052]
MSGGGNVKVVVRCRPLNQREITRNSSVLVRMDGNQTILTRSATDDKALREEDKKAFTFDKSFWSVDPADPHFADQEAVYNDLGEDLMGHAFDGYNCCIFAYGQTGSGKSYSMMGYGEDKGIIPRACQELFDRIANASDKHLTYRVEVTYIEIYNEKVRDLLNPKNKDNLRVREHPRFGPYVEDLSRLVVNSYDDISHLMDEGNKARTVAATNMNETSSRSHAVFTIFLTQRRHDTMTKLDTEKVARVSLVDLAGSERANSSGATGQRLKEGANINRSLTTLGKVIAALAEQSQHEGKRGRKKETFIPYRDSTLTWLLKDSLGGNSKTTMIATISPASENYEETLSTLRYADQAKKIKNKAIVNEDPNAKLIRELKAELEFLKDKLMLYAPEEVRQLAASSAYLRESGKHGAAAKVAAAAIPASQEITFTDQDGNVRKMTKEEIVEQMLSSEKLFNELNETWEEKLKRTEAVQIEREQALAEIGVTVAKNRVGVYTPKRMPHLVNLNEDPLMSECLMYQIKPGRTLVGRQESDVHADIRLSGPNILDEHCYFENTNGIVTLYPGEGSMTMVNGTRISEPRKLSSGCRIILGDYHIFRLNHPEEVRRERNLHKSVVTTNATAMPTGQDKDDQFRRPESPTFNEQADWKFAKREAVLNESDFGDMDDEELEKLFDDISKVRNLRRSRPESRMDDDASSHSGSSSGAVLMPTAISNFDEAQDETDESATRVSTTDVEEKLRLAKEEMQRQLEIQKNEYEEKIKVVEASTLPADEIQIERDEMHRKLQQVQEQMELVLQQQRQEYETRIKRISQQVPEPLQNGYTATQWRLMRKVVQKWKKHKDILMAEAVMLNSVILKEANVIAKELGKSILYQFCVLTDEYTINPVSFWENGSSPAVSSEEDVTTMPGKTPCIGIRAMDSKHNVIYYWSLEKLKQRLQRMRNLYNFIDRPMYRKHFNWEDPFYETPIPRFTCVGKATLPVRNLALQQPLQSQVQIICPITGKSKGLLTVLVSPLARSPAQSRSEDNSTEDNHQIAPDVDYSNSLIKVGEQLLVEIQVLGAEGISESDCTQVHAQFRLSEFGTVPPYSAKDKIFSSDFITDFGTSPIDFGFSQTVSVITTPKTVQIFNHGFITIEVFAHLQSGMIESFRQWDEEQEQKYELVKEKPPSASTEVRRDSRDDPLYAEQLDVFASIQLSELALDGEYIPTQVLLNGSSGTGVFLLRQGIQRRIFFSLTHSSGRQFPWQRVIKATFGNVRLVDAKGQIVDEMLHEPVPINLLSQQQVDYRQDGTSTIDAQGAWDSSLHEAAFLNQITAAGHQVQLTLSWEVEADKCDKPLQFSTDVFVQIQGRDASNPSKFRTLITPTRITTKITSVYVVQLRPPQSRNIDDLWRTNTSKGYVRGEEFLGNWKPRSISIVREFQTMSNSLKHMQDVVATRQMLYLQGDAEDHARASFDSLPRLPESKGYLLKHIVDLWTAACKHHSGLDIIQTRRKAAAKQDPEPWKLKVPTKLVPHVKPVIPTDVVTKKGYLSFPENADEVWVKRWIVFKRPYLHIYLSQSDYEQQGIINLSQVKIDYKKDLEKMLEVSIQRYFIHVQPGTNSI